MGDVFGFDRESVARIWRAVLAVERYLLGMRGRGPGGERTRRLPRTYRRFTLTAQLDAGSSATVEWPEGTTGTVYDRDTCCWGLEGETGEAAAFPNDAGDGIEWRVTKNPGQGIYKGTLDAAATSTGTKNCTVVIEGDNRTVAAVLRADPGSGQQWPQDAILYIGHFRGSWEIVSITECQESQ